MKPFESFLASTMEDYILYRHNVGYSIRELPTCLSYFDRYLTHIQASWESLQPSFFLGFIQSIKKEPSMVNAVMCAVRGFFQFLIRRGILNENPLHDIPPIKERVFIPFVFSEQETEKLLTMVREKLRKTPEYFLKDLSVYLAILLLARCGLRISEPTHLLLSHYRAHEGTIYIEKTKFKKDRLLPIPTSLIREMTNYLAVRKSLLTNDQNPYLLYGRRERGITKDAIYPVFHQVVRDGGFYQPRHSIGTTIFGSPTPHCLRHAFAVNTLKRLKERGKSPQEVLPVLAAYMGHCKYKYTAAYLKVVDAEQKNSLVHFTLSHQGQL